jgi:hypothetical protein
MTIKFSLQTPYRLAGLLTGLLVGGLLLSKGAQAQDLRLFEPVETEPGAQVMSAPEQLFTVGNGQPAFTLRSTARFGDQYQAMLISRTGEIVKVSWREGESAPVPGIGGFTVVGMSAAGVSLDHPGEACVSAELSGVLCQGSNRSELRLAIAAPVASNGTVPVQISEQQAQGFFGGPNPTGPDQFNGAALPQEARAARLRQFEEASTIDDADIPPGMHRVRTPFGDRFIQNRE